MSSFGFLESILEIAKDGPALSNTTTPTELLPTAYRGVGLPASFFDRMPRVLLVEITGRISTNATTPGTLALALMLGSIAVMDSGNMTLNTTAQTNTHWKLKGELVARDFGNGTGTQLFPKGWTFRSHAVIGSAAPTAGGAGEHMLPYNTAPALGAGFDNSVAQFFGLRGTWSAASANNSIQVHCGHIRLLN